VGIWASIVVIVTALVVGSLAQFLVHSRLGYEWIVIGIGAGIAASVAGLAHLGGLSAWGPTVDDLHVLPALAGAVLVSALLEIALWAVVRPTTPS
jgi:hypothetical protein